MSHLQIICTVIGVLVAAFVIFLVRHNQIKSLDGVRWFSVVLVATLLGSFPVINDAIGETLGIGYPPIIPALLGLGVILFKLLINDTSRVSSRVEIERLIQRVSILEAELEQEKLIRNSANIRRFQVNRSASPIEHEESLAAVRIEPVIGETMFDNSAKKTSMS